MKPWRKSILPILFLFIAGCITQFIPETEEAKSLLVVEGMITDQPEDNIIKISLSMPLGDKATLKPLKGCIVTVTDDRGSLYSFSETVSEGTYKSDMQGIIGRKYILHIRTRSVLTGNRSYQSMPMEMIPVPPVDSVYYEKVTIAEKTGDSPKQEGCQIYLNTHDPTRKCRYYRWNFNETWEFRLPFQVQNSTCWISENSNVINIKNTNNMSEDRINRYPLQYVSNESDRLSVKYSILVNQYSLSMDEFDYWEKVQNVTQDVGGLYDIIPASIAGNITCTEDPSEMVLGYFSVSAKTSKRIFIRDHFSGLVNQYYHCYIEADTLDVYDDPTKQNITWWILEQTFYYTLITHSRSCADCTTRGDLNRPDFWDQGN